MQMLQSVIRYKRFYTVQVMHMLQSVIDDLRKSRGLHSVSAYRHGLYIAQSCHAFVGGTVSTWAR